MSRSFPPVPADEQTEGPTPDLDLLRAARTDDLALAQAALTAGANPSHTDQHGRTARELAAEYGHRDVVRLLDQVSD